MRSLTQLWRILFLALLAASSHARGVTLKSPPALAPEAVLRLEGPVSFPKLQAAGKLMAFTDTAGRSLRVLDLSTNDVIEVTPHRVGPGYFWSPDGARLFYRELIKDGQAVVSQLQAYDTQLNRSALLETLPGSSGYPTYDPYKQTAYLMHDKGILAKRLEFPGVRPSPWQKRKPKFEGQWIATQGAILWLTDLGLSVQKLQDDGSGVQSYSISPDGQRVAWATEKGTIFTAQADHPTAIVLDQGRDPSWNPSSRLLIYAAARKVGVKTYDYDLKISDTRSPGRFITQTPDLAERWPQWLNAGTLLYTLDGTTDLFRLRFDGNAPLAQAEIRPSPLR